MSASGLRADLVRTACHVAEVPYLDQRRTADQWVVIPAAPPCANHPRILRDLPAAVSEPDRAGLISAMPDRVRTVAQLLSVRPPGAPSAHGSLLVCAALSPVDFAAPVPQAPRPGHTDRPGSGPGRRRIA